MPAPLRCQGVARRAHIYSRRIASGEASRQAAAALSRKQSGLHAVVIKTIRILLKRLIFPYATIDRPIHHNRPDDSKVDYRIVQNRLSTGSSWKERRFNAAGYEQGR